MNPKNYDIYPLSDIMGRLDENVIRGLPSSFRSVYDSATESFLREKALDMGKRDLSRTHLAISKVNRNVIGYITLSIKCMVVPKENLLSGKTLKGMNIESSTGVAQSYLLGQLSRSKDAPKGLGGEMLDLAFDKLGQAKGIVGCRMVRLDCHDELIPYYTDHGFRLITKNGSGSLNQMMAFV